VAHSFNNLGKLNISNILSIAINQHTPQKTACCFSSFFGMDELHVHTMAGVHKFSKKLEAISKTYVSEE
jgi:hypothetical protein